MSTYRSVKVKVKIDIQKEAIIDRTPRIEMLETMFDVPATTKLSVTLQASLNLEERPWNVGLIVGPSGSGKTLLLENLFGSPQRLEWYHKSVIDDFRPDLSMGDITRVCQSVGFNSIPSWMRPFSVLSNGERFRVEIARRLLGNGNPFTADSEVNVLCPVITIDEFTSVVDRQVAQITAHAVQKYVREKNKKLVAASCHYDIIDWLQPDWILEPGKECKLTWRSLQRRPPVTVSISRVKYETWRLFRDYHYMTPELNRAARCYGLFVKSAPAGMDVRSDEEDGLSQTEQGMYNAGVSGDMGIPSEGRVRCSSNNTVVRDSRDQIGVDGSYQSDGSQVGSRSISQDTYSRPPSTEHAVELEFHKLKSDTSDTEQGESSARTPTYRIASMCGVLYRPHPKVSDIVGISRVVTLPDWQGLGLAHALVDTVASAYRALGKRLHNYPNHPAYIRTYQRNRNWICIKESGQYSPRRGSSSTVGGFGGKRCAVYCFVGPPMNRDDAEKLINGGEDA